ncbi:MAG: capsule assembly Wzi family protein, partial [Cyclobacteriaceae bacterium]|nr:capsule assembly Wzi family protein [Cyclobacteriaceae bacterium]
GFHYFFRFVSFQIRPSLLFNQNKDFETFYDTDPSLNIPKLSDWWNRIDTPEYLSSLTTFLPGDSYLKLNYKKIGFGISTENLWWGPGQFNSLIMTNNAAGIPHLSLQTEEPVNIKIGTVESRFIMGRLTDSGLPATDPTYLFQNKSYNVDKPNDTRIINGLSVSYQPKWISGLFLGFSSTIQQYRQQVLYQQNYLPLLRDLFMKNSPLFDAQSIIDKNASVYMKWRMKNSSVYCEIGNFDDNFSWLHPARANGTGYGYILGFSRYQHLKNKKSSLLFQAEITDLQQPPHHSSSNLTSWYIHDQIRHGYTQKGQIIGAGIGPGGNLQTLALSYISHKYSIGTLVERWEHNKDYYFYNFTPIGNFQKFWVDYTFNINAQTRFSSFGLSADLTHVTSLNYQWLKIPYPNQLPFAKGNDKPSVIGRIRLEYLF